MFPSVQLMALGGIIGGVVTLAWYNCLDPEKQLVADRILSDCASDLFGKPLERLTSGEAKLVNDLTHRFLHN